MQCQQFDRHGDALRPPDDHRAAAPRRAGFAVGTPVTLSVTASPSSSGDALQYDWYAGPSGNTSSPYALNASSSIPVTTVTTTSYWVRVTEGACYRDFRGGTRRRLRAGDFTNSPQDSLDRSGKAMSCSPVTGQRHDPR